MVDTNLKMVKLILEINDDKQDALLNWMLDDVTNAVLSYCHIKTLPSDLNSFVVGVVVRHYIALSNGDVASIKRGDTTVSYHGSITIDDFTKKDKARLNYQTVIIYADTY